MNTNIAATNTITKTNLNYWYFPLCGPPNESHLCLWTYSQAAHHSYQLSVDLALLFCFMAYYLFFLNWIVSSLKFLTLLVFVCMTLAESYACD